MNGKWLYLVYAGLISAYSLYFDKTPNSWLLIAFAAAYALSQLLQDRFNTYLPLQVALLLGFHAFSATDLCLPLYWFHLLREFERPTWPSAWTQLWLTLSFGVIALTYKPLSQVNFVSTLFITVSFYILFMLFRKHIRDIENQKQLLTNEKKHLSTHDALTGLYNYQEFHRQLERLVDAGRPLILVMIDCKDLKSLNTTNGFQGVNKILRQAAQLLRIMFPEASLISRYGGDEFAIVVESEDIPQSMNAITRMLASEFPKLTGIDINFGMACYPQEGMTKDDLILIAERSLYLMKRDTWLKREEHMLRSEKLRVVGELASGMAHEIRNPLTTIKGFLQLSKAGNYNIKPWYDLIMDEINRMSMLTAEFLQFSKPHMTQFRPQKLQSCIYRVISLLDSESTRLGHHIDFQSPEDPVFILMDQDKMLQLLLNLIKNAFEAIPEQGTVLIKLSVFGDDAVLEIEDNGKGIPDNELEKIFIPFYTTKDSGTGLGLSICHKIVQDHDGTIEVESELGIGTKFTITLPVHHSDSPAGLSDTAVKSDAPTIYV